MGHYRMEHRYRMEQHAAEIEPFAAWLAARKPHHAVEVGVRHGGSLELWHSICTGLVVGVDWLGRDGLGPIDTLRLAADMQRELSRYYFVCGDSHMAHTARLVERALNGDKADFLFLDGDHSLEGVSLDYQMYSPLVRKGGCIAFHDIVDTETTRAAKQGVAQFWRELEGEKVEFCENLEWGGLGVLIV